jgi:hypothetical protein
MPGGFALDGGLGAIAVDARRREAGQGRHHRGGIWSVIRRAGPAWARLLYAAVAERRAPRWSVLDQELGIFAPGTRSQPLPRGWRWIWCWTRTPRPARSARWRPRRPRRLGASPPWASAGEAAIGKVAAEAGFTRFRRAAQTPFNLIYEIRP